MSLMFSRYMFLSSSMWLMSSCGSPSSNTTSLHRCRRSFRLSLVLEEQSVDPGQGFCCCWGASSSIFSAPLQQSVSLHPPPLQPESAGFTSRSSIPSETELTLGGGFSKASLMLFIILSSCCEIRCRRSVTEAGTGLSGCLIWHQLDIALWRDTQRGNSVRHNGTQEWLGQKRVFNNEPDKRGSGCFWARKKQKYDTQEGFWKRGWKFKGRPKKKSHVNGQIPSNINGQEKNDHT